MMATVMPSSDHDFSIRFATGWDGLFPSSFLMDAALSWPADGRTTSGPKATDRLPRDQTPDRFEFSHQSAAPEVSALQSEQVEGSALQPTSVVNVFRFVFEDMVRGTPGNDVLMGGLANDILKGGDGRDVLLSFLGADFLIGGTGADVFVFGPLPLLAPDLDYFAHQHATISDFASGTDKIDLSRVADNLFFVGDSLFSGTAGEVRIDEHAGYLDIDVDGDAVSDMTILFSTIHYGTGLTLAADDFIF